MNNRIAILTTSDFPYHGAGENFTREMASGLIINSADVEVIRFWGDRYSNVNDTGIKCSDYLFRRPAKNELLKVIELCCQLLYMPFFILSLRFYHRRNILILNGLETAYFVFPVIFFGKLSGLKCYRVITEIFPESAIAPNWWRKPVIFFYNLQLKKLDKYLSGVIVLSRYLFDVCMDNGVKKERIILIPNFIDLKISEIQSDEKILAPRICYCGIASIENGILDLLKAFSLMANEISGCELIVIGDIPERIRGEIKRSGLDCPRITFKGQLSKDKVREEYSRCQIFVNPRKKSILADSGFPTKIGEYFLTGKPVVSTRVGDLPYYFADKKELVFAEPDDPVSISESIIFLHKNPEEAKTIGENGYRWATDNLDPVKNAGKLLNFFSQTAN